MGVHFADNPWWLDVLEWGPASPHARSFDIDWDMLPVPRPRRRAAADPRLVLWRGAGEAARSNCATTPAKAAFPPGISSTGCRSRPSATARCLRTVVQRSRRRATSAAGKQLLDARSTLSRACAIPIARRSAGIQGRADRRSPAAPTSSRAGSTPIAPGRTGPRRRWRCIICWSASITGSAHWRLASSDINYRRFFDINSLAGLRVEDAGTFDAIHRLVQPADRRRPVAGPAARPHRRPARSRAVFPAAAPPDPRRARQHGQAVLPGDRENSRRARAAARVSPACTAPPAMNG